MDKVEKYFTENAKSWLSDAYELSGYNYPTPLHRKRVVTGLLKAIPNIRSIMDIGCGGADVSVELGKMGYDVLGIDQSPVMLKVANENIANAGLSDKVTTLEKSVDQISEKGFDAIVSMGLIGYLESDEVLFEKASTVLNKDGYLIISFRNQLFNLFSLSQRTLNDIEKNEFKELYEEAQSYYNSIEKGTAESFMKNIQETSTSLLQNKNALNQNQKSPSDKNELTYSSTFEARQSTPEKAKEIAEKTGFDLVKNIGIHPHLMVPGLNKILPPTVYNLLSDTLTAFEEEPISMLWSSVFIGVYKYRG
jgi:2-polyprenyl-3-methyl-5-hydroxy-6-metoxy-1,4-benzoquinol methylase